MEHNSRLFGRFTYQPDQIITFSSGLLGFPEYRRYVVKANGETAPVVWLLSIEEGGPELALIDPEDVGPEYSLQDVRLEDRFLGKLRCNDPKSLKRFAVVTLPDNIKQVSMNLRTPVFIDPRTKRGLQYPKPGLERRPVRCLIYRNLIGSDAQDKPGMLVILRKENETVDIGDEISIQILDFEDGGVRLGISAPRRIHVSRGDGKVTPLCETKRANERMDLKRLEGIMRMYRVMRGSGEDMSDILLDARPSASVG